MNEIASTMDIANDSDQVTDLGPTIKNSKKHILADSHDGKCTLYCPSTKHKYLHLINVPNKFALICRGCKEIIYS